MKVTVRFEGPQTPAIRELLARLRERIDANARDRAARRRWPAPDAGAAPENDGRSKP